MIVIVPLFVPSIVRLHDGGAGGKDEEGVEPAVSEITVLLSSSPAVSEITVLLSSSPAVS